MVWNYLNMNVVTMKRIQTRLVSIASYISSKFVFTVVHCHYNSFSHRLTAWKEFSGVDFIILVLYDNSSGTSL